VRRLIVTADDFGLAIPVNEAVERAHSRGILTAASLMVTATAAEDAVERAHRLKSLGVGLHLVLVQGRPALAPAQIPDLVGPDGRFPNDPLRIGLRIFFSKRVQLQVEAEMRAQFELFRGTGLKLDHVNGHHHLHQHPTIVGLLIRMAGEYGIRAVRLPIEPFVPSWRAQKERLAWRFTAWLFAASRFTGMRRRLGRAGIACNDHIFGLHESGRMTPARVGRFLSRLPAGVSEIYCHPATRGWQRGDRLPESYLCIDEFEAVADPAVRDRLREVGVERMTFTDLAKSGAWGSGI
jgi:hopanoid biosynthesis associated protein HpnK